MMLQALDRDKRYNLEEFERFLINHKDNNYELIDGYIYVKLMANTEHQDIEMFLSHHISNYLVDKKCKVFANANLRLSNDTLTYDNNLIPDLLIVCDNDMIKKNYIEGTPELIIEIASPSNLPNDYILKHYVYGMFGVKEYWIVNPIKKNVHVHLSKSEYVAQQYTFDDIVKSDTFEDLEINFKKLEDWINKMKS